MSKQPEMISVSVGQRDNSRADKADKILAILKDYLGDDLTRYTCLDVGCSAGAITHHLANKFRFTVGFDLDRLAIQEASANFQRDILSFGIANGALLPLSDSCVDVVICAQVYEHAADQQSLADEIWRVLRPGGVCFFSGPNRLAVMEEHYWLPFLSWLPRPLANWYMRTTKKGNVYDINPLYYWQIQDLWRKFDRYDYTPIMIKFPSKFSLNETLGLHWVSRLPLQFLAVLAVFFPNYNWILVKR